MACKRCGHCCISLTIVHSGLTTKDADELGLKSFFEAHHCIVAPNKKPGLEHMFQIRVPLNCKYLSVQNGVATCVIYDKRPRICSEYRCERAKKDD